MSVLTGDDHDYEDYDAYRLASGFRWNGGRSRPFSIGEGRYAAGIGVRSGA